MKIINLIRITLLVLLLVASYNAKSQTITTIVSKDRVLKDTVIKGVTYKIHIGPKGGRYSIFTAKSGNMRKKYWK